MSDARIRGVAAQSARAAEDVTGWLAAAGGPLRVDVPGIDDARVRIVTTLLHGNEPSGVRALHRWLRARPRPATRMVAFVLSVEAALGPPPFAQRARRGARDLNRCFGGAADADAESALAAELLRQVRELEPEAVVDIHNTSARGPAYAVVTRDDPARRALTTQFASRMVVTDLRLGALIEALEDEVPAVVIECGGASDPDADSVALAGLERLASAPAIVSGPVTVLHHPRRVELDPGARLAYAAGPGGNADVTLDADIGRHNFGPAPAGTRLGWLGPRGLAPIRVRAGDGRELRDELLETSGGELRLRRDTQLLMATADVAIATSDCLFYAIPIDAGGEP